MFKPLRHLLGYATILSYKGAPRRSSVSRNRKPRHFAVYRVMAADSIFFVSNHATEERAKHSAACRQACAPDGVSYVVDPPHGPLSSLEPKLGVAAALTRLFGKT